MKHSSNLNKTEINFVSQNLKKLTNKEMLSHINANRKDSDQLTIKMFLYRKSKKSLKHCDILRWKPEMVQYLKKNYQTKGNVEIAETLTNMFQIDVNKKQVEKKMILMGLKRTPEHLAAIFLRNKQRGRLSVSNTKMWEKRGITPEGERKIWDCNGVLSEFVKVNGSYTPAARHVYLNEVGDIPKGYKVYHRNCNRLINTPDNLYIAPAKGLDKKLRQSYAQNDRKNRYEHEQKLQHHNVVVDVKPIVKTIGIPVIIDAKTTVYVKPGTNIEAFKLRMQAHMA